MGSPTTYPLAPSAWGAGVELGVDNPVQALLFSDTPEAYGTAYIDVALEPDPLTRGWRVRAGDAVIGEIGASQRARFPSIERVHASGHVPTTTAGVRLDAAARYAVDVYLPPEQMCVPRNNVPADSRVLDAGDMVVVDTSAGEFSAEELASRSPGQWLVGLSVIGGTAVASLDGRVLGTVGDVGALAEGETVYARAHILAGMVGLDVAFESASRGRAVPGLSAPPEEIARTWSITTFPDGTWAVSVARDDALDPEDFAAPAGGARRITSPAADTAPPPSIDFTPTTSFRASSSTYLSEVEKLRLRRERDSHSRKGRHRK